MIKLLTFTLLVFLSACKPGFQGETTKDNTNNSVNCPTGQISVGSSCVDLNQTRSCITTQPSHSSGGTESTSDAGLTWGSCIGYVCDSGYSNYLGSCQTSNFSQSCVITNGTGTQSTTDGGNTFSSCTVSSCNSGYTNVSNSCVPTTQSRVCSSQPANSNGGLEYSTNGGVSYGSCSGFSCNTNYVNISGSCVLASQSRSCTKLNGTGVETTSNGGVSWSVCTVASCDSGFVNVSNSCVSASQTQSCTITNGTGLQTSSDGGVSWGTCSVQSCDSGFTNVSNSCLTSNQTRACSITNGSGTQSTTDGGQTWTSCTVSSCDTNYSNVSNSCVLTHQTRSCVITNGSGLEESNDGGLTFGSCTVSSCDSGYTQVSNSCIQTNQSRVCSAQPSNSNSGTESTSDAGLTWGSCIGYVCNSNYVNISGTCTLENQTRACTITNGTGSQSTTDGGLTWSTCSVVSCNTNYTQIGNTCVSSNQNRACTSQPANSNSGLEYSTDGGQTYGACTGYSCNSSYVNVSGNCVLANQTQSCAITNGIGQQTSNDGGVSWGTCTVVSCDTNYTNVSNSCVLTNQTQSCAITNGTGSQSSTDGGQTWGSCNVSTCDTNYTNVGNTCVLTNQSRACAISNGTGTQSSTDGGQTWGSCSIASCNTNYSNVLGSCVLTNQTQSCAITNGTGSQSTTDGGLTWSSCSVSSCDTNYTNVSNSCVLTNQSRSCSITNGTGTQSSTDGGVSWGTCTVSTCDTNYTNVSNTCSLTNQSRSCSITNGTGTQSTTDGGATWNTCSVASCDSGYSQSGNSCIAADTCSVSANYNATYNAGGSGTSGDPYIICSKNQLLNICASGSPTGDCTALASNKYYKLANSSSSEYDLSTTIYPNRPLKYVYLNLNGNQITFSNSMNYLANSSSTLTKVSFYNGTIYNSPLNFNSTGVTGQEINNVVFDSIRWITGYLYQTTTAWIAPSDATNPSLLIQNSHVLISGDNLAIARYDTSSNALASYSTSTTGFVGAFGSIGSSVNAMSGGAGVKFSNSIIKLNQSSTTRPLLHRTCTSTLNPVYIAPTGNKYAFSKSILVINDGTIETGTGSSSCMSLVIPDSYTSSANDLLIVNNTKNATNWQKLITAPILGQRARGVSMTNLDALVGSAINTSYFTTSYTCSGQVSDTKTISITSAAWSLSCRVYFSASATYVNNKFNMSSIENTIAGSQTQSLQFSGSTITSYPYTSSVAWANSTSKYLDIKSSTGTPTLLSALRNSDTVINQAETVSLPARISGVASYDPRRFTTKYDFSLYSLDNVGATTANGSFIVKYEFDKKTDFDDLSLSFREGSTVDGIYNGNIKVINFSNFKSQAYLESLGFTFDSTHLKQDAPSEAPYIFTKDANSY